MKLGSPFKDSIRITQTYHSNKSGMAKHNAVDMVPSPVKNNVYAGAAGKVVKDHRPGNYLAYIAIQYIGMPYEVLYVHVAPGLKVGALVKRGDVIGTLCPSQGSFKKHLHLALQGTNPPGPMAYLDRGIKFIPGGPAIERAWFKNGEIDWSKFYDYQIEVGVSIDWEVKYNEEKVKHKATQDALDECKNDCIKRDITIKEQELKMEELEKEVEDLDKKIEAHLKRIKELEENLRKCADQTATCRIQLGECRDRNWFSVFLEQVFGIQKAE